MSIKFFLVTWTNKSLMRIPTISLIVNWLSLINDVESESMVPSTPGDTSCAVIMKLGSMVRECSRQEARLYVMT